MTSPTIANASAWMPPPPRPCTARAPISWFIDCADPHMIDPIRKITIVVWKIRRRPWRSDSLPSSGVPIADVTMYAVPTHAKLSNPLNSPVIVGSAVAMIDVSSDASRVASISAPSTTIRRRWVNPGTLNETDTSRKYARWSRPRRGGPGPGQEPLPYGRVMISR